MELIYWVVFMGIAGSLLGTKGIDTFDFLLTQFHGYMFGFFMGSLFYHWRIRKYQKKPVANLSKIKKLPYFPSFILCIGSMISGLLLTGLLMEKIGSITQGISLQISSNLLGMAIVYIIMKRISHKKT